MEELGQTRAFVAAADALHLGRAARQLGIHPATLAARLRALESRLEVVLVDRSHRCRIALTQAGAALLPAARRAVGAVEAFEVTAGDVRDGTRGVVRVALTSEHDPTIDGLVRDLRDVDEAWEVEVLRMDVAAAGRAMAIGAVECAVGRGVAAPRTTPGLMDPRPNRLERARVARVVDGPRGAHGRTLVVAWRGSWASDSWASDPFGAALPEGGDGVPIGRSAHAEALVSGVRRMIRAAEERWRPEVAARRRADRRRRAVLEDRRRAVEAERELVVEETARLGEGVAAARARARERAEVLRLVAEARAAGQEISVHLLIRCMCLPDDERGAPARE